MCQVNAAFVSILQLDKGACDVTDNRYARNAGESNVRPNTVLSLPLAPAGGANNKAFNCLNNLLYQCVAVSVFVSDVTHI